MGRTRIGFKTVAVLQAAKETAGNNVFLAKDIQGRVEQLLEAPMDTRTIGQFLAKNVGEVVYEKDNNTNLNWWRVVG